jgi:hypothetical protein
MRQLSSHFCIRANRADIILSFSFAGSTRMPSIAFTCRLVNSSIRLHNGASGDYRMHHGVSVSLRGDFQASFFTLEREGVQ